MAEIVAEKRGKNWWMVVLTAPQYPELIEALDAFLRDQNQAASRYALMAYTFLTTARGVIYIPIVDVPETFQISSWKTQTYITQAARMDLQTYVKEVFEPMFAFLEGLPIGELAHAKLTFCDIDKGDAPLTLYYPV